MSSRAATVDVAPAPPAPTGPLTGPGRLLCAGLLAWMGGEMLYAFAINDRLTLLSRFDETALFSKETVEAQAILADHFRTAVTFALLACILAFIAGWALFVGKALSAQKTAGGPSAGLGAVSIFIPVLNLFMPFGVLKSIWAKTHPADLSGRAPAILVAFQWAFALANLLALGSILLGLIVGAGSHTLYELHTYDKSALYLTSLGLWMGGAVMAGVSAILLMTITMNIMRSDAQTA